MDCFRSLFSFFSFREKKGGGGKIIFEKVSGVDAFSRGENLAFSFVLFSLTFLLPFFLFFLVWININNISITIVTVTVVVVVFVIETTCIRGGPGIGYGTWEMEWNLVDGDDYIHQHRPIIKSPDPSLSHFFSIIRR